MKNQPSVEFLRECLICSVEAGTLHWRIRPQEHFLTRSAATRWNDRYAGKEAGHITAAGYRTFKLTVNGKRIQLFSHCVIWAMATGVWPANDVDHANTIRDDNRKENLREATRAQNKFNSGPHRDNKLGLKGVRFLRNRFQANINCEGKRIYLGTFDTPEAASKAYQAASVEHHGNFSRHE